MAKIYGVVFSDKYKKSYYRSDEEYEVDNLVVVDTSRGEIVVKVVQVLDKDIVDIENIKRLATEEDYNNYMNNLKEAKIAFKKCMMFANELKLDMQVVNCSFNLDKSQLLFNFTSSGRVDFRDLAKKLAGIYHTRIELHQIGARDRAKEISGIGVCGQELCCSRFLKKMDTISMNMAKNQNLALNPSKINGVCGRLLCCLAYEDKTYVDALKNMPSLGDKIVINDKEGIVISVDILNNKCKVLVDGEKIDYEIDGEK